MRGMTRRGTWLALSLIAVVWGSSARGAEPLTLAEALFSAAGGDEVIGIGEQDLALARAEVTDQTSSLLPTLEFSGGTGRTGDELGFLFGQSATSATEYAFWRAETLLTAPLLAPADIADLVVASRALDAQEHQLRTVRYEVLYDVVRTYYEALSAHQAVQVAQATAAEALALEDAAQRRLDAGDETRIGVMRASGDRIAADGAVEQARFDAHAADLALAHAAHLPLQVYALSAPAAPPPPTATPDRRIQEARTDRPDLAVARWDARAAEAAVHAEGLELAPELQLRWGHRYSRYDPEDASIPANSWTLMLRATWELTGMIEPVADIRAARAQQRRAQLSVSRLDRVIELDVRDAEITLEAAATALVVARERDAVAQANLEAGMQLYREGMATNLEVSTLRADREAAAAELVGSALDRDLSEVGLLEVLGVDPLAAYGGASASSEIP
jgi:outer membrane protein